MHVEFSRYDAADYLETEQDIAAYLDAVVAEGEPALIAAALADVARARNLSQLARDVGMTRQDLNKVFSGAGNPSLPTLMKISQALDLRLPFKRSMAQQTKKRDT